MLFDPERHIPITDAQWSEDAALAAARTIYNDLSERLEDGGLWPKTLDEKENTQRFAKCLYDGAAGTIWGMLQLSERLDVRLPFDPVAITQRAMDMYLQEPDTESVVPSLLLGETGILLLQNKLHLPSAAPRLRNCIAANERNPVNEALWGCPGTMLAALYLGEDDLYRASAAYLLEQLKEVDGLWIWEQDLYGRRSKYIGAGHGFFGNAHALLEGQHLLSNQQRSSLLEKITATALASARRADGRANWMPGFFMDNDPRPPLTQWCHGAPGIITSLRSFPKGHSVQMDQLLVEAGELVWAAGPLKKGIGICHGTDGNGYALLRVFERSGDEKWLARARQFAMHALNQRNGRSGLWTGETGLALFLTACVDARADFPIVDYF